MITDAMIAAGVFAWAVTLWVLAVAYFSGASGEWDGGDHERGLEMALCTMVFI
jgi:hypothetical protein